MNERLKRALRYPLFLLAVAFGAFAFMMIYVVPQIMTFLNSIDSELPMITRVVVAVSDFVSQFWWVILLAGITITAYAVIARRMSEDAARLIDRLVLRVSVTGSVWKKLILARFAQSLALLFQSGMDIPESLQGAKATLGNRRLATRYDHVIARVTSGSALSTAMSDLFPPLTCRIIRTRAQSGQLGKSLSDIAATYDREASDATD